ncbi:MAG TPA: complex I NDUFA9 subunit family protein [Candidatus Saccharimonadales bacterium]|nr:complex I NDUFA9 subunit family protein [Candidatus Saccharimonadales bacterium]
MATILVTGATGFVGSHTVPALLAAGHRVIGLVRTSASATSLAAGPLAALPVDQRARFSTRTGDVTEPASLPAALAGVAAIVHLVAIPRDFNSGRDLARVNIEGTRNVVQAAHSAGVRRFVHLGAMGVVEDPNLHYANSKALAERIVRESSLDWTILKPSLMWGEGDGFFGIIARLARWSPLVIPVPGNGKSRFQPLWVGDLAHVIVFCLEHPETVGQTHELGGPTYWTYREITREVLGATGRQRVILPMPVPLISLVARANELIHGPFPVASDQLRQLKLDNIGPLDGVSRAFGVEPRAMNGHLGYLRRRGRSGGQPGAGVDQPASDGSAA